MVLRGLKLKERTKVAWQLQLEPRYSTVPVKPSKPLSLKPSTRLHLISEACKAGRR